MTAPEREASVPGTRVARGAAPSSAGGHDARVAWHALALLLPVSLLNYLDRYLLGVLMPSIKADLGLSDSELGFISGVAFSLFYATVGIPLGRYADDHARRPMIAAALFAWSLMTACCGLAQGFLTLALCRILVGVGEAGATPPSHALLADLFPRERRATALAVFQAGSPAGILAGFSLGGLLAEMVGWRAALMTLAAPGLVWALVVWRFLPERAPTPSRERTDTLRTLRELARIPSYRHLTIGTALFASVWFALMTWLPSFLGRSFGMPMSQVGPSLGITIGIAQLIGVLLSGIAGDRLAARSIAHYPRVCAAAVAGALPLFAAVLCASSASAALLAVGPAFLVAQLQTGPQFAALQAAVGPHRRGVATATFLLATSAMSGVGAQVVGSLSDAWTTPASSGLPHALLVVTVVGSVLSVLHFLLAARTLAQDAHAAR